MPSSRVPFQLPDFVNFLSPQLGTVGSALSVFYFYYGYPATYWDLSIGLIEIQQHNALSLGLVSLLSKAPHQYVTAFQENHLVVVDWIQAMCK